MWTTESTERLIEEYRSHPELWDVGNPEYKNMYTKNKIWKGLADTMGVETAEVRIDFSAVAIRSAICPNERETALVIGLRYSMYLEDQFGWFVVHTENLSRTYGLHTETKIRQKKK